MSEQRMTNEQLIEDLSDRLKTARSLDATSVQIPCSLLRQVLMLAKYGHPVKEMSCGCAQTIDKKTTYLCEEHSYV